MTENWNELYPNKKTSSTSNVDFSKMSSREEMLDAINGDNQSDKLGFSSANPELNYTPSELSVDDFINSWASPATSEATE